MASKAPRAALALSQGTRGAAFVPGGEPLAVGGGRGYVRPAMDGSAALAAATRASMGAPARCRLRGCGLGCGRPQSGSRLVD